MALIQSMFACCCVLMFTSTQMCCLLQVKVREGFELLWEPESLNVCFYYIPPSMRSMPRTDEWKKKLNKVCVCVCVCVCVMLRSWSL